MTNCRIKDGKFFAPNENESILYRKLADKVGEDFAKDLFVEAYTPSFKEQVEAPLINKYKNTVVNNLNTLQTTDKSLVYKLVESNGFKTIQMFDKDSRKKLGYIRLKNYGSGYQVEAVNLTQGTEKGQGLGTELYKQAIRYTLSNNVPFYSDASQTQSAQNVWNKLESVGITVTEDGRKKVPEKPKEYYDQNGEIKYKYVLKYATAQNQVTTPLSFQQTQELKNALASLPVQDSQQLLEIMEKAFYKDFIFSPTQDSLRQSGLYNKVEIQSILNNTDLQAIVKDSIERLKHTNLIQKTAFTGNQLFGGITSKMNSFGKLETINPAETEQDFIRNYVDQESLNDVDALRFQEALESPEFKVDILREMENYKLVPVQTIVDGELVDVKEKLVIPNAVKVLEDYSVIDDIEFMQSLPAPIQKGEKAIKFSKIIEKKLVAIGIKIDIIENLNLLQSLKTFLLSPGQTNTDNLNNKYSQKTVERNEKVVDSKLPLIYLKTALSETEVFDRFNLIQTTDKYIYHKTQKVAPELMQEYLKDRYKKGMSELDTYKTYFGHPIESEQEIIDLTDSVVAYDPSVNLDEFVADFNIQILEDTNNSDFYKHFTITDEGIEMIHTDEFTVNKVKDYLGAGIKNSEKLQQYSLLKKDMPSLVVNSEVLPGYRVNDRINVVNSPQSVPLITDTYQYLTPEVITVKNSKELFIRTPQGIFELMQTNGNLSFYQKLEENRSPDVYNLNPATPVLSIEPELFLQNQDKISDFVSTKSILKSAEKKEIEDKFACLK